MAYNDQVEHCYATGCIFIELKGRLLSVPASLLTDLSLLRPLSSTSVRLVYAFA